MERLTTRVEDKVYYSKGKYPPTTLCAEMETHEIRECMKKLAEYEDTGYNPKELKEIKSRLSGAADTINMLSPLMMENYELKKERDFWKREAIKWCAELGEQKIYKAWLDSAKE